MSPIVRALFKALLSLLHPKMLLLMLLPVVAALLIWLGIGWLFWQQAVSAIDAALQTWPSLNGFQWLLAYWPMTLVAAHVAVVLLALLMIPVILVTTVLVVGIFAMPVMVSHVAARNYAQLEKHRGGTFSGSVWNGIVAGVVFILLAVVTLPLWLFPPWWPALSLGLLGYVNQRALRYDALGDHGTEEEMAQIFRDNRLSLFVIGVLVALAAHVPLLGFFAPVYGGLVFIHYLLDRLRELRARPLDATFTRIRE